jgi:bacillithiol biosynthesis deacetylase BshB1
MTADVLAIGAHPDDVDLSVGGTLAKLSALGHTVTAVDLTRGEGGTRGTPEERRREAEESARILGLQDRMCLDMGDTRLANTPENRIRLIEIVRKVRPVLVLAPYWDDLHPDHARAGEMTRDIMYTMGMANLPAKGDPHLPHEFLFFMGHFPFEPSFIVDVSEHFQTKLRAVQSYRSQLADPDSIAPQTGISQPDFLLRIEARARHYGSQIRRTFGEPFLTRRPVPVHDPVTLYAPFPKMYGS